MEPPRIIESFEGLAAECRKLQGITSCGACAHFWGCGVRKEAWKELIQEEKLDITVEEAELLKLGEEGLLMEELGGLGILLSCPACRGNLDKKSTVCRGDFMREIYRCKKCGREFLQIHKIFAGWREIE